MNRQSSAWTGRAPRTLSGAFGPYTSRHISESERRWRRCDWCIAVLAVGFCAFIAFKVIP